MAVKIKKGLIVLLLNRKAKAFISLLAFIGAISACVLYVKYIKPNALQVYLNDKPICFVHNENEFKSLENEVKKEFYKRFGNILYDDNVRFEKVKIKKEDFKENEYIKNNLIKASNMKVNAVMMKSDSKKVGVLANESEMRSVLDKLKNYYIEKDKNKNLKLSNKITYIEVEAPIREVNSIDEVYKNNLQNEKQSLISFKSEKKVNSDTISRGGNNIISMVTPSQGQITSPFGFRWGRNHDGIDIGSNQGSNIVSAMDGTVCYAEWCNGYGNLIQIDHGNGIKTYYGHCSTILVKRDQNIKKGEKIGEVGSTGNSTGPHLHFEVRINEVPQNPLKYLK